MKTIQLLVFLSFWVIISNAQPILIGKTTFDLQTNGSAPNRIQLGNNGEIFAAYTGSLQGSPYADRGTFLQTFKNNSWQAFPNERLESIRTGFPALVVTPTNKQFVVTHDGGIDGLVISTRNNSNSAWVTTSLNNQGMWPRAVCSGGDTIHMICLNSQYGTNKHIRYFRSINAGLTWDINGVMLAGSDSLGGFNWDFSTEGYTIDAKGNTVAIVLGGKSNKTVLYKSTNGGTTFNTKIINEVPYDYIDGTKTFSDYRTPGGFHSVSIGSNSIVHFFAGKIIIVDPNGSDNSYSYYPGTDSLLYWNDNMDMNSMTSIAAINSTIGGYNYFHGVIGSLSSAYDFANNKLSVVFDGRLSSNNGNKDLFVIQSSDDGISFTSPYQITNDAQMGFENIYPSIAKSNDNLVHVIWQKMNRQGLNTDLNVAFDTASIYYQKINLTPVKVTFRVDLVNNIVSDSGIHIVGNFQNWDINQTIMKNDSGSIFIKEVYMIPGNTVEYKFVNGNEWMYVESGSAPCFGFNNLRSFIVPNNDTILPAFIFNTCSEKIKPNLPFNVPSSGLLAWYPFNGNAIDSSGNENNGDVFGPKLTKNRFGMPNNAYSFNGISDYIYIGNLNALKNQTKATISFWVNSNLQQSGSIFSQWTTQQVGGSIGLGLNISNMGSIGSSFVEGNGFSSPNQSIIPDFWNHVVFVFDGTQANISHRCALYVNGIFKGYFGNSSVPDSIGNLAEATVFGSAIGPAMWNYFNGKLDDIGIWNRALSIQEISALYTPCNSNIVLQPRNVLSSLKSKVKFAVKSSNGVNYQWQLLTINGFQNLNNGGQYSGVNSDTLTVSNLNANNDQQRYRCVVYSSVCSDTSVVALLGIPNVPEIVPINGLLAWYPFSGNAIDSSGNGNNLTVDNASLTTDRKSTPNSAFSFDGYSSSLSAPFNLVTSPGVTIAVWGNVLGYENIQTFLNFTSDNQQAAFGINYSQNDQAVDAYAMPVPIGSIAVNKNVWNHYVITSDNATNSTKFYCNGILIGTSTTPIDNALRTELNIGRHHSDSWGYGWFFNGKLDDIGIWNRALTQEEISNLYNPCSGTISSQPTNAVSKLKGSVQFVVKSIKQNVSYQWQINNGNGFQNITNGNQFTGAKSNALIVSNINQSNNQQRFRCVVQSASCIDTSIVVSLGIPNVPEYVPTNGLLGWWPFTGNASDSSGYNNNLSGNIPTLTANRNAESNSAYLFNGYSDYLYVPITKSLKHGITFSAWANVMGNNDPSPNNIKTILNYSHTIPMPGTGISYWQSEGVINAYTPNTNWDNVGPVQLNKWYHYVITVDAITNTKKFYVNGVLTLSENSSVDTSERTRLAIGRQNEIDAVWHFNGKLDDIGMWSRPLTEEEVFYLYSNCKLSIVSQTSDVQSSINKIVKFSVSSNNPNASYQWQTDLGLGFQNITNAGQYVGANMDTLVVTNLTLSNNNQWFRCIVKSGLCSDTSAVVKLTVTDNTGVNESDLNRFISVYPNPASSQLIIKSDPSFVGSNYVIIDNLGRVVLQGNIQSANQFVDISSILSGFYHLKIGENMRQSIKIIKE